MMPASNAGVGGNIGFPDVCLTQVGPAPVPIPYPNISLNPMSVASCYNVLVTAMPLNNMMTKQAMTNGMQAGAVHPAGIMKPGGYTMGNPIVIGNGLPAQNLLMPTNGNGFNNPIGATLIPSAVNVVFCSAAGVVDRELTLDDASALHRSLGIDDDDSVGISVDCCVDDIAQLCVRVSHVRRRTAAALAGVQVGDDLRAINGARVAGMSMDDLGHALRAIEGEAITFGIERGNESLTLCATQPAPDRRAAIGELSTDGKTGVIEVRYFNDDLPRAVAVEIARLQDAGATALELDLRDNPGGDLDAMLRLADDFADAGCELLHSVEPDGDVLIHRSRLAARHTLPLALRVNAGTASAAELLAACLQHIGRATVVGEATHGKCTAQTLVPAGRIPGIDHDACLTVRRFVLPDGRDALPLI